MAKRTLTQKQIDALAKGRWINNEAWRLAREISAAAGGVKPASYYRYKDIDPLDAEIAEQKGQKPYTKALGKARKEYEFREVYAIPENLPTLNYYDLIKTSPGLFENSAGSGSFYMIEMNDDDNLDISRYRLWEGGYTRTTGVLMSATEAKNFVVASLEPKWDTYDEAKDLFYNEDLLTKSKAAGLSEEDLLEAEGLK